MDAMGRLSTAWPTCDMRPWRVGVVAALAAVYILFAPVRAEASTIVSGANDTGVPLVIDPADDPQFSQSYNVYTGQTAFFIQKMPTARTVRYVTLGGLKSSDACDGQDVQLVVEESDSGMERDWHEVATADAHIGPYMGRVTWNIPDTVFHAGKAYGLFLFSGDFAPCSVLEDTTWAHNNAVVNGGSGRCARYVDAAYYFAPVRYWHVKGEDDVDGTCANGFDLKPSNFDPSMPTGWLVVYKPTYTGPQVVTSQSANVACAANQYDNSGQQVDWPEGAPAKVCEYPQFAARAQEVTDGWYYSQVLLTPPGGGSQYGAVRDLYVRLSDQAPAPGTGNTTGGGTPAQQQPPTASDEAGDGNPAAPALSQGRCLCADPIDAASGNLTEKVTDLRVEGRGLPLEFSRSYNSLFAGDAGDFSGRLGPGWSGSWSMHITAPTGSGPALVHNDNGSTVPFTKSADGTFSPPAFVKASLLQTVDGYTYTQRTDHTTYRFGPDGTLLSATDRNGYTTTLSYDGSGRLASVTNAAGAALHLAYDANGQLHTVSDDFGRSVTYDHDSDGTLTAVTDAAGATTHYGYDVGHRLTRVTDANSHATTTVYGDQGQAISQTDATGATTTLSYDANQTTVTDPRGNRTVLRFDSGQMTSQTEAVGTPQERTTTYKYDDARNLVERDEPTGTKTTWTYDADARVLTQTDGLGRTTNRTYTDDGYLASVTNPAHERVDYSYDTHGNLTRIDRALTQTGQTATDRFIYDPDHPGDVLSHINPAGDVTQYAYDAAGRLVSRTDGEGDTTSYRVNGIGQVTAVTDPRGNVSGANAADYTTLIQRDPLGRVLRVTDPAGNATITAYDGVGNKISVIDPNGHETDFSYDADNRLLTVTRPDHTHTDTRYDAAGNVTTTSDGLGHATSYAYDALNRRVSTTDPLGRMTRYGYDAADRRTQLRTARGDTTTYGYDNAGQLTSMTFSNPAMHEIDYGYDNAGRRISMTDGTGQSQYSYDSLGRLTEVSTPGPIGRIAPDSGAGALLDGHENVDYGYDLAGRVTKIQYPDSLPNGAAVTVNGQQISNGRPTVTRRYDHAGRLVEVDDFKARRFLFTYDPAGHLTAAASPNATSTANVYDRRGNLTRTTVTNPNGTVLDLPFSYDANNLLTSTTATSALSQLGETYSYDALNQITSATVPTGQGPNVTRDTYAYDAGDRITAMQQPTVNLALSYDNADQLTRASDPLTNTTLATFTYDADGNRTATTDISGTTVAYDYNQRDELTRYRNQASTTATTLGAHVSSTMTSSTPADETYHYNGDGLRADFIWDPVTGIPQILEDKTHLFIDGPAGLPLEEVDLAGNALYYHHDQLGSTRLLTNQDGHPVAYSDYDPYGRPIKPVDATLNPIGFAGQYTDPVNGLIYMRARWYDPATGSFLTTDPLGPAGGDLDPYGYAGRDPVNELDPTGFCRFGLTDRQFYGTVAAYADFEAAVTLDVAAALQFTAISAFSLTGVTAGIIAVEGAATLVLSLVPWYATYRDIEHAWS